MPEVIMYATRSCPYCLRAEKLLKKKGVSITKIDVAGQQALWDEMEEKTGRNTVPQIFIGDQHIGGYDDLAECDMEGKLDRLLAQ